MRTDLIAALSALALLSGMPLAKAEEPTHPAVGETSQSLGVVTVDDFLDRTVVSADAQPVGTVQDVLLGPDGQPLRLIVSTGTGGKDVSIDLSQVEVRTDSDALFVSTLTRDDIQGMPAFESDGSMTSLNASRPQRGNEDSEEK